jgi:RHS repeat-associated protein
MAKQTSFRLLVVLIVGLLAPRESYAQLAPTGAHYGARPTDTGFAGPDAAGGYSTSVPLDLPTARGGLPIPLQLVSGGARYGTLGVGWDIPLSFVYVDGSYAHRRPTVKAPVRVSVSIAGRNVEMLPVAGGWVGRDAADLKLVTDGSTYTLFDGSGLTYVFIHDSALKGTGGADVAAGLWLLSHIDGPGGSRLLVSYEIQSAKIKPTDPSEAVSINITHIRYNRHPSDGCFKNDIALHYGSPSSTPKTVTVLGLRVLTRYAPLDRIDVTSVADCASSAEVLRKYSFGYQVPDVDSGQDRLSSVTVSGRDIPGEAPVSLPVAAYGYGAASFVNTDGRRAFAYSSIGSLTLPPGALPGAGLTVNGHDVGASFDSPVASAPNVAATLQTLIDLTGDGRADLVFRDDNGPSPTYRLKLARNDRSAPGGFAPPEFLDLTREVLDARSSKFTRFKQDVESQYNEDNVWTQTIDINGDGRLDIIDAAEKPFHWIVYLNVADSTIASGIRWERRAFDITKFYNRFHDAGWQNVLEGGYFPLSRRVTGRDYERETCWVDVDGKWYSAPQLVRAPLYPGGPKVKECNFNYSDTKYYGAEQTYTEWALQDMNGDGYPDFTYNFWPIEYQGVVRVPGPRNATYSFGTEEMQLRPRDGAVQTFVHYNTRGVFINDDINGDAEDPFGLVSALTYDGCGVGLWTVNVYSPTQQYFKCGFIDINGDGIPDRVGESSSRLGTGMGFGTVDIPSGRVLVQESTNATQCGKPIPDIASVARHTSALREVTGDGIPDLIERGYANRPTVYAGTGFGFSTIAIEVPIELSREDEYCNGTGSRTAAGMFDVDGDAKPEYVVLSPDQTQLYVYSISKDASPLGVPEAGRLNRIDNGYGAVTSITYRSAKTDTTTKHQTVQPEIVVDSVQTTGLAKTSYAYGRIDTYFDTIHDAFRPTGYLRRVETTQFSGVHGGEVRATVTDSYDLDSVSPQSLLYLPANQRFGRYLKVGRPKEVYVLAGSDVGADAWALLASDLTRDTRRIAGTQYEISNADTKLFSDSSQIDDLCFDMMFPDDFEKSKAHQVSDYNPCNARGFLFTRSVLSWRGSAPPPSTNNVQTFTAIGRVDDLGRTTSISYKNDITRSDDDFCVDTDYASSPPDALPRVLTAVASTKMTNCSDKERPIVYAEESWEYDNLPTGLVSTGLVTSHTIYRHDGKGEYRGTIRDYDVSYDAHSNPRRVDRRREDGANRTVGVRFDTFGLTPTEVAVGGSDVPELRTVFSLDPLTNNIISTTDPNGTTRGRKYDAIGRVAWETFKTASSTSELITRATTYSGFYGSGSRTITTKQFTDGVAASAIGTTEGRISTTTLDSLGRSIQTIVELGDSYGAERLKVGYRKYDELGRVFFAADAHPVSQATETAYGTTYYFNADGSPLAEIRGSGPQSVIGVSNAATDTFPTLFKHTFTAHQEKVTTYAPDALTPSTPQTAVAHEATLTAIGRVIARSTFLGTTRLEYAELAYDLFGRQTLLKRFAMPANASNPVEWTWAFDSVGQLLGAAEPGVSPHTRKYSDWGELLEIDWAAAPPYGTHAIRYEYDAYGRLRNSRETNDGVVDDAALREFKYDYAGQSPFATPTNLLGRLASAHSTAQSTVFGYDAFGNVNTRTYRDADLNTYFDQSDYHADGSIASVTLKLPDNGYKAERVDYAYDSAGAVRWMWFDDGVNTRQLYNATQIDPLGRTRVAELGGGMMMNAHYDSTGRRLPRELDFWGPSDHRRIKYNSFDSVGRELSRSEDSNATSVTQTNTYDILGRLKTSQTPSAAWGFTYDPLGNLTRSVESLSGADTKITFKAPDRDRACALLYFGGLTLQCNTTYDNLGNTIDMPTVNGSRQLSYFNSGRVKNISMNGRVATFRYDPFDAVAQLDIRQGSTLLRSDRNVGEHVTVRTQTGAMNLQTTFTARKFAGPGFVVSRRGAAGPWVYQYSEGKGTRFTFDEDGNFLQDVSYTPFGAATSTGVYEGDPRFTTLQWNSGDSLDGLGVLQVGARIYDPAIGRFLSRDPLVIPRSATTSNPYSFAWNDPINLGDPTGLDVDFFGAVRKVWNSATSDDSQALFGVTLGVTVAVYAWRQRGPDLSDIAPTPAPPGHTAGDTPLGKFTKGFGLGIYDQYMGFVKMGEDPWGTTKALIDTNLHPDRALNHLFSGINGTYQAFKNGDIEQIGRVVAHLVTLVGPLAAEKLGLFVAEEVMIARNTSAGTVDASLAKGATMDTSLANGSTVRHSATATAIGDDAATLRNFNRSQGTQGHDVIVHGNFDAAGEVQFRVNGDFTHTQQIADAVLANPAYTRGTPINLVSCYGACGTAQELSAALGGVRVNALPVPVFLSTEKGLLSGATP